MMARHSADLAEFAGFTEAVAADVKWYRVDDKNRPTLPDEFPALRWAGLPEGPFHDKIMDEYRGSKHTAVRSADHGIGDVQKAIGFEVGECHLINVSMPRLRDHQDIVQKLQTKRNWDHIFANAPAPVSIFDNSELDPGFPVFVHFSVPRRIANPHLLFMDFAAPNAHFSDYRNMEGKATRYTDEVILGAAAYFRGQVRRERKVVTIV